MHPNETKTQTNHWDVKVTGFVSIQKFTFPICDSIVFTLCDLCLPWVWTQRAPLHQNKIGVFGTGETSKRRVTSCAHSILGFISYGDASFEFLKSRSKIQTVTETNWTTFAILGLYANLCVEISGNE